MQIIILKFLSDQRTKIFLAVVCFWVALIGSFQEEHYIFSFHIVGRMIPAFIFCSVALWPAYKRRRIYKYVINRAYNLGLSKQKILFYLLMGFHGKLLGIYIAPKSKIKWALMIVLFLSSVIWILQSDMPILFKTILLLMGTYKFIRSVNS